MSTYPKTEPYVYCGLAAASYYADDPIAFLKKEYKTSIHDHIRVVDKIRSKGWDYVLFENQQNNSLIVAFRGTDIADQPSEIIADIFNEIGDSAYKPIVKTMSKQVSKWLDTYNRDGQYDEVSFVGHSEGGLFARFVLYDDERINFRVTFNTAKPRNYFNFRTKDDPISLITGFAEREKDILFKRNVPDSDVWTICKGVHAIAYFNKRGILFEDDTYRKSWKEVKELTLKFKEDKVENRVFVKRWWSDKNKRDEVENSDSDSNWNVSIMVTSLIVLACSYVMYNHWKYRD